MTISRLQRTARYAITISLMAAGLGLAACNRNAAPAATNPGGEAATLPPERPALLSAANPHATPTMDQSAAAPGVALKVKVSLAPALAKQAAPEDVVYIFARAVQGPRMPLAIVRKQVKDLPTTVVLDDSSGMMSDMKLSSVPQVVVIARVSKTGNPSAQAGDLEGQSGAIKPGAQTLDLSIAEVLTGK